MKNLKFLPLAIFSLVIFSSCEQDAEEVNEEEVITTVTTTLTAGESVIVLKSTDLDGDSSNAPVVTVSGNLLTNTTYKGLTTFSNELKNPFEDITTEVNAESDDHQLFYQTPATLGIITYTDKDKNGKPIGLSFDLKTGSTAATGDLTVTLKHKPNKSASMVSEGNIANAGGSTDANVIFPIKVVLPKF